MRALPAGVLSAVLVAGCGGVSSPTGAASIQPTLRASTGPSEPPAPPCLGIPEAPGEGLRIFLPCGPPPTPSSGAGIPTIPSSPTGEPITDGDPIEATDEDPAFRLTLRVGQDRYRAGQPIDAEAILVYLGRDARIDARGPGTGLIGFGVENPRLGILIGPAFTSDCSAWPMERGVPVVHPFEKSGGFADDDPLAPFMRAYFADAELRLPPGTWEIGAGAGFYPRECGAAYPRHSLSTRVTITVEP